MINQRLTHSLRFKLVASSVLIQIVFITLLVSHNVNLVEETLVSQSKVRLYELERLLNTSIASPVVQQDVEVLQEILDESVRKDGINYFALFGANKKLIAAAGDWDLHTGTSTEHASLHESMRLGLDIYHTHIDISIAGIKYGQLHYGISIKSLSSIKNVLIEDSIIIAILGIVISGLALLITGIWLTRNLTNLAQASQQFASGNFTARANVKSNDEVKDLALAFNFMADSLNTRIQDLRDSQKNQQVLLKISQQEKARLTSLLEVMTRGILFETIDQRVAYYNPAFINMWGLRESQNVNGCPVSEILENIKIRLSENGMVNRLLQNANVGDGDDVEFLLINGIVVIQRFYRIFDEEKNILGTMWIFEDVTAERQTAEQLVHLAEHDFLTGLYNRRKFEEEINKQIEICRRHNTELALVFFDIDDFKFINDAFGHKFGDEMLVKVASDVGTLTRTGEMFCRLGGDEFAIFMPGASMRSARLLADRILTAMSHIVFSNGEKRVRVTSSVGISLFPKHAIEMEELLVCADIAMYQAKEAGKNTWKVYEENKEASEHLLKRINWDHQITNALENDLLILDYQGVFDIENEDLIYLEALVRMKVKGREEVILPGQFIPFAERSGKIIDIDRWVIKQVISNLANDPSLKCVAVNVSGRAFGEAHLARYVTQTLENYQVNPNRLMLELTETAAVGDLHDAQYFIDVMKDYGCRIAIDDFGSGYASFIYLKHLKADVVKIDGLFIHDLVNEQDNQLFVKAIVDIARGLKKKTVAEYVEDECTFNLLKALGVDYVQGYYLHEPSESCFISSERKVLLQEELLV